MAMVRTHCRRNGVALLEAALVFPLLLLLTLALIEYGWLFMKIQQTTNAARHGLRAAVVPDATTAEAHAAVATLMTSAGLGSSGYSVTFSPSDVSALSSGDTLSVTVTVPYENISLTGGPLVPVPGTITASMSMAKEGP
jgi:Flp pilus assembly protein TadG